MADNRTEYVVTVGGVEHTMLLDPEGAKRYGDAAVKGASRKAVQPENKAATPANKAQTPKNK